MARVKDEGAARRQNSSKTAADSMGERYGLSAEKGRWRRLWRQMLVGISSSPEEVCGPCPASEVCQSRLQKLECQVFACQSVFVSLNTFRSWLLVGAGYVEFVPGGQGQLIAAPPSVPYTELDSPSLVALYRHVIEFLRSTSAQHVLWPELDAFQAGAKMDAALVQAGVGEGESVSSSEGHAK